MALHFGARPHSAGQDVHAHALAHQRLGELAHVAREAALDHRRVLPGQDEHAGAHPRHPTGHSAGRPLRYAKMGPCPSRRRCSIFAAMSPYSWFAAERIGGLLPQARWEPVFAGGLFRSAGRKSWGLDERREENIRECESRAARARAGPDLLAAAVAHQRRPRGPRDDLRRQPRPAPRVRAGSDAGRLPRGRRPRTPRGPPAGRRRQSASPRPSSSRRCEDPAVKEQLRATTDGAHELGVIGVPTVVLGEQLFWGDDRLEEAARAVGGGRRRDRSRARAGHPCAGWSTA